MDTGGNGLVRELGVALRGDDRGVSENLLERRQRTAALQPPAGERVPELVGTEPGDPPRPGAAPGVLSGGAPERAHTDEICIYNWTHILDAKRH